MAKGDDAVKRKKNRASRKKLQKKQDSSTVSARVAAIIAAKKRRKSGKRRICQGMCFSLPTPDDPYNERHGKDALTKNIKNGKSAKSRKGALERNDNGSDPVPNIGNNAERPKNEQEKDLTSDAEQIAWIVSIATDSFARKEKEGLSLTSPFLLYLVPTAEKAAEVRAICKPLKALGIHTVSIHSGASIDHQIHGLTSCEPEFLVSTPERLLELITLKAIDISQTSLLVVDGVRTLSEGAYLDMIKSVRQFISGNPRTVVFNDCLSCPCTATLQNLLNGPIERLSLNDSITSLSSCAVQCANVCTLEEEKLLKQEEARKFCCLNRATRLLI
ncbi:hypothetical protein NL676_037392 [Syzygium grande]|nr:hypothetical protein NL676_037392 [Syzygium grande]